ncbi:uncharacterized protein LOC105286595 isoform X2 [Ooceraea biroi]|uniref:uncharacterized protein LOC105286595 isoform X2 n=1 Tax=Ooceraea biroi TaxID=2015173 RepID=UPI000F08F0AA|nr:uncharacterized protein LOC105286595 isoform X2 [Ooceraea biroi]
MASGDNVDVIEVVETTNFIGPTQRTSAGHRLEQSTAEEDYKSIGEKTTALDSSVVQHGGTTDLKTPAGVSRNISERERKIGHRRVGADGEITYKKIQTSQIMGSIQLGIQHAVGSLASKPERDLLMQDFMTVETTNFPSEGSNHTPAHHFSEFKFKNYAPIAFRYFRDLFGIEPQDFLMSMCHASLRELSNPGASGSIFYLTSDDEFIVKTVQHKEGEFLQTLLPGYYMNLNQNPRTLLPKFFGLYCYRCNSKNIRLVAMNNLLPSIIKMHQKYDLKGSTYKRKASKLERSKSSPTYKDLDFIEHHPEGIFLEADTYSALVKTIQRDCRVLESFKIMDYSLLVGIHNLDQAAKEKQTQRLSASADEDTGDMGGESDEFLQNERDKEREDRIGAAALNRSRSINRQKIVAHSTAMESIQAESEPIDEEAGVPSGGIPARNARGERLLLFLGVIDILQSYRLKKKLEHTWKSMIHDGDTVSVHRPGFYAQRFQDFMAKTVFKKIPSLDLPEIKGNHRKFRNLVTSYIALKHSPSKRKSITRPLRPLEGDFDSTVSPPDPAISATNAAVTSGSVPIATSTPVSLAAGPLSPPPLTLAAGQGTHHEHPPGAAPTAKVTSYPAVLKGRSAASPPNPNLVPSGKIPPPVPPRGTGASRTSRSSEEHRAAGTATSTSSSVTSSRGDEAAIITRYRLHDNPSNLHHLPLSPDCSTASTSITTAKTVTSTVTADTTSTTAAAAAAAAAASSSSSSTKAISNLALHARTKTFDTYRVTHRDRSGREVERDRLMNPTKNRGIRIPDEDEEFVSVEKVEGAYFIKTSPHPFRPQRGIYRSDRWGGSKEATKTGDYRASRNAEERKSTKMDHVAKFTYPLNPGCQADLINYKMSRKDKKHSETYYERMKRRQKDLEASITTITTISRRKSVEGAKAIDTKSHAKSQSADESTKRRISRYASIKKNSTLLQKIRKKSRRKKRLAPKTPSKTQTPGAFNGNSCTEEKTKTENKRLCSNTDSRERRKNDDYQTFYEKNKANLEGEKRKPAMRCDKTSFTEKINISDLNREQENKRGGFKGIFPKDYRVEARSKQSKVVREQISKFDQTDQTNLKKLKRIPECKDNQDSSKLDCSAGGSYNKDTKKDHSTSINREPPRSTTSREVFASSSLDNIRNGSSDVVKFSVSEKVKSSEKIKRNVRDEARRGDIHLYNFDHKRKNELGAVKQKFALPADQTRLNQREEKISSKARMLCTEREQQIFRSFSSGHCNDPSLNPREFGRLPNVSFLHTYQKTIIHVKISPGH